MKSGVNQHKYKMLMQHKNELYGTSFALHMADAGKAAVRINIQPTYMLVQKTDPERRLVGYST